MKHLKWGIPSLAILAVILYFQFGKALSVEALNLIPEDAMYVLDCEHPIDNWKELSEHQIWQVIKQHSYFSDLTIEADYLDSLIEQNSTLMNWFGDRRLLISAHPTAPKNYDFLFVTDLKSGAKREVVFKGLQKVLEQSGFEITSVSYHGYTIVHARESKSTVLHFTQIGNQLVCSYTGQLINKAIDASENPRFAASGLFQECYKQVSGDGIARLYVQYGYIDELMDCYFTESNTTVSTLSKILGYSAVDFKANEESWQLNGFTTLDSVDASYLHAVAQSGTSVNTAGEVLSNRTAWYLSLNFNSFSEFRQNLEVLLKDESTAYSEFLKNQKRIETLLNISVERDLLNWIGSEVTVAQMRNNLVLNSSENAVIMLKAKDINEARERLDFIGQQVKRRTPAKFKQIDYRNYKIEYLDIKGFFKTFFGKAFDKIEKPFYVLLGDYVVFSNSPYTLIGLIEDYEFGRNLSSDEQYQSFTQEGEQRSITLYSSPQNFYPALLRMLDHDGKKALAESKTQFESFNHLSLQLTARNNGFNTQMRLGLASEDTSKLSSEKALTELYDRFAIVRGIAPESFVVQLIEDGIYKKYFPNSKALHIEAETRKGILHGKYKEYYSNGKLRAEGKYKSGRKKGTWKIYDASGNSKKVRF